MRHLKIFEEYSETYLQTMFDSTLDALDKVHGFKPKNTAHRIEMFNKFKEDFLRREAERKETVEESVEKYPISDYDDFKSFGFDAFQKNAIKRYKNWGSDTINMHLRGISLDDTVTSVISLLDSCLKRTTVKEEIVLRIVEKEFLKDDFVEKGYLSTSCSLEYLEENLDNYENPQLLKIIIPANIKYCKPLMDWTDFEKEILFERNLHLKKIDVEGDFLIYKIV